MGSLGGGAVAVPLLTGSLGCWAAQGRGQFQILLRVRT